jgi:hypothetical protein
MFGNWFNNKQAASEQVTNETLIGSDLGSSKSDILAQMQQNDLKQLVVSRRISLARQSANKFSYGK